MVHTGDLFDRSQPERGAWATALDTLGEVGQRVPVLMLPGNHDRLGLRRHFGDGPPGVRVVDEPAVVRLGVLRVGVIPYRREAAQWAADAAALAREGFDLLACHQSFDGARVPGFTFRAHRHAETVGPAHLPAGLRHILCGHIHTRQVTRVGAAVVVQPGSTERASFEERHEPKGYGRWSFGREVRWEFAELPARPMLVLERDGDVSQVHPGTLVKLRDAACTRETEAAVARRGGWVAPYKVRDPRQARLFGPPPPPPEG